MFQQFLALCVLCFCLSACTAEDVLLENANKSVTVSASPPEAFDQSQKETPEQKAIRLAEEHIARNGYTKTGAERDNISFETVEFSGDIDELLRSRHDTLNPRAYGVLYRGRLGDEKGWTIVFEYSEKMKAKTPKASSNENLYGRAVTMNEHFENLLVQHKDFVLKYVDKVLD